MGAIAIWKTRVRRRTLNQRKRVNSFILLLHYYISCSIWLHFPIVCGRKRGERGPSSTRNQVDSPDEDDDKYTGEFYYHPRHAFYHHRHVVYHHRHEGVRVRLNVR